jgi:hypothetical protein
MAAAKLGWQFVELASGESPDFVVGLDGGARVVGLEVTETVDQQAAAGWPAAKRIAQALEHWLRARRCGLSVHLSFANSEMHLVAPPRVREAHLEALSGLISALGPKVLPDERHVFDDAQLMDAGAPIVRRMLVVSRGYEIVTRGSHGEGPSRNLLQERIRAKDSLLGSYRLNRPDVREFWLLTVGSGGPGALFLTELASTGSYKTSFDWVFYLDVLSDVALEVSISPPT